MLADSLIYSIKDWRHFDIFIIVMQLKRKVRFSYIFLILVLVIKIFLDLLLLPTKTLVIHHEIITFNGSSR